MDAVFKRTNWTKLQASECRVVERNAHGGVRVDHPALYRPRWFNPSRAGNLVSRYTGRETQSCAAGFIIDGLLN